MTAAAIKIMPHSTAAEQSLLGGLLIDPEAISLIAGSLVPEDFYAAKHKTIYQVILDIYEKDARVDLVTVSTALTDKGQLVAIGGLAYLNQLVDTMPSSSGLESYAALVKEKAVMRSVVDAAEKIQVIGLEEQGICAKEYLDRAEALIMTVNRGPQTGGFVQAKDYLTDTIQTIEDLHSKKRSVTGVPTGFADLDKLTAGLQPSDLIIIAGRPSMGKTSIALNMAYSAVMNNVRVGVFSLEMSAKQLLLRLLSSESEIDQSKLRTGQLSETEWAKLPPAAARIEDAPIFIDDSPALNILEIRGRARRLKQQHNIGLLVVDYLQLITAVRSNNSSREQEISEISRFLKALAKELNIPIVALSQLNRKVEERSDKRPVLADLRESGAIEQDADVILFIYRDEVYSKGKDDNKGIAEVIIGKQRNGPTDTVKLGFLAETMRFVNLYHYEGKRYST